MPAYDAVIFDLDGLLLDTERLSLETGMAAFASLGHPVSREFLETLIGIAAQDGFHQVCAHLGVSLDWDTLDTAWTREMDAATLYGVPLRPGVTEMLARLDAMAMPRGVATNSGTLRASQKIEAAGIAAFLPVVVGFDQVAAPKPAPDVYLEAARRLRVDPARCLAFDDSDPGVRAAVAAGMTVVQVPDMVQSREHRAHHYAASLLEGAVIGGLWG